jgi:hypothetical protein
LLAQGLAHNWVRFKRGNRPDESEAAGLALIHDGKPTITAQEP